MKAMTNLEVLEAYRGVVLEMQALEQQLQRYGSGAPREAVARASDEVQRSTNHQEAAQRQHMDSLERQLLARRAYLDGVITQFERVIADVGDATTSYILRGYYALGDSDAQIATVLHCSEKTVNRKRKLCLARLAAQAAGGAGGVSA